VESLDLRRQRKAPVTGSPDAALPRVRREGCEIWSPRCSAAPSQDGSGMDSRGPQLADVWAAPAEDPELLAITCFRPRLADINQFSTLILIDRRPLLKRTVRCSWRGRRDPGTVAQVGLIRVPYEGTTSFASRHPLRASGDPEVEQWGLETFAPSSDLVLEDLASPSGPRVATSLWAPPEPAGGRPSGQATEAVHWPWGPEALIAGREHSISRRRGRGSRRPPPGCCAWCNSCQHADRAPPSGSGSSPQPRLRHAPFAWRSPSGQLLQIRIRSAHAREFAELRHSGPLVGTGPASLCSPSVSRPNPGWQPWRPFAAADRFT